MVEAHASKMPARSRADPIAKHPDKMKRAETGYARELLYPDFLIQMRGHIFKHPAHAPIIQTVLCLQQMEPIAPRIGIGLYEPRRERHGERFRKNATCCCRRPKFGEKGSTDLPDQIVVDVREISDVIRANRGTADEVGQIVEPRGGEIDVKAIVPFV